MGIQTYTKKIKKTPTRKTPFLPRITLCIELGSTAHIVKYVPILETLAVMVDGLRKGRKAGLMKTVIEQTRETGAVLRK